MKSVKEDVMVNGVKGRAHVKLYKECGVALINGIKDIISDGE